MLSLKNLGILALLTLPASTGCATVHDWTPEAISTADITAANLGDGECSATGPARVIAHHAMVPAGIEATASDDALAIGFSVAPRVGVAVGIDPETAMPHAATVRRSTSTIRRVTPTIDSRAIGVENEGDVPGARLQGARKVVGEGSLVVGVADGALGWSEGASGEPHAIWSLPGGADLKGIDGLRAVSLGGAGSIVAFRKGSSMWIGAFSRRGPMGHLVLLPTRSVAVGAPALVANGDAAMVGWQEGDTVRWARWAPGLPLGEVRSLENTRPAASALWPSLARAGAGNVLLVWTEADSERHDVRSQVLTEDGAPVGRPSTLARDGAGAIDVLGHASASVGSDGRGVVAFLASSGDRFDVVATPIACAK